MGCDEFVLIKERGLFTNGFRSITRSQEAGDIAKEAERWFWSNSGFKRPFCTRKPSLKKTLSSVTYPLVSQEVRSTGLPPTSL